MAKQAKALSTITNRELVVLAAEEIRKLNERLSVLGGIPHGDDIEHTYRAAEISDLYDRLDAFRSLMTVLKADTLTAAMGQVEEVFRIVNDIDGLQFSEGEAAEKQRALRRCLYSIAGAVRQHLPPEDAANFSDMEDHLNPWLGYERQVEIIRDRRAAR